MQPEMRINGDKNVNSDNYDNDDANDCSDTDLKTVLRGESVCYQHAGRHHRHLCKRNT
jgi:hypothetical protein